MDETINLIAQFGAVGVLVWLVFHIFRSLIPELFSRIIIEIESQRREFTALLREQTTILNRIVSTLQEIERRVNGHRKDS